MADSARIDVPGFTPETLNVQPELLEAADPVATWTWGDLQVSAHKGRDTFWIVMRKTGAGGLALRTFPLMGAYAMTETEHWDRGAVWRVDTHSGVYRIELNLLGDRLLRMTSRLTPACDLLVAFWPRDLYPIDAHSDPRASRGRVEAAQRGLNGGYCYFCVDAPHFANVLYMQNLGAMNPYFATTKVKPDGVVGGEWPELGYQPPTAPNGFSPPVNPLHRNREYVISDALIAVREDCARNEFESARGFVDMLADIYPHLDKPEPQPRDWLNRAQMTLADLKTPDDVLITEYGHSYLHPYTASEYPDSMVQMSVLATLREYERALGIHDPLSDDLAAGMAGFYDDDLKALRRYLPNVGNDKNKDAVDSWYLYHPLMNLARLAIHGEAWAKDLFFKSLDFVIRVAQHFDYVWPILYDMRDFSVIEQSREGDGTKGLGQTDVGGIYAYVMLQAHQLSGDGRYLDEAKKALKQLEDFRFELAYQTNLTAWGAVACLKLWRLENDNHYLDQSLVFVASFLHNCELWSSELDFAAGYANFFGVTCLHDGPYMAAYEAFECFMAFDEYLHVGGADIPASARLLLSEYWRHALDVLWGFYPDTLPPEAIATQVRNGHIDRDLSFPLEDLYGDGSQAGQVGQEIYGAGAAFVIAARAWSECPGMPVRIFADRPSDVTCSDGHIRIRLLGPAGAIAALRIEFKDPASAPDVVLLAGDGEPIAPISAMSGGLEYRVAADGNFAAMWQPAEALAV